MDVTGWLRESLLTLPVGSEELDRHFNAMLEFIQNHSIYMAWVINIFKYYIYPLNQAHTLAILSHQIQRQKWTPKQKEYLKLVHFALAGLHAPGDIELLRDLVEILDRHAPWLIKLLVNSPARASFVLILERKAREDDERKAQEKEREAKRLRESNEKQISDEEMAN